MEVRIWGCRGSTPAPLNPRQVEEKIVQAIFQMPDIDTADADAVRAYVKSLDVLTRGTAGGNTTCVEIRAAGAGPGRIIVIDAGTGIRELGLELMKGPFGRGEGELHLLFSHPHWDHIQGFPFFMPAFIPGNRLFIYSTHDLRKALMEQQRPLNFPVPMSTMEATIEFITLEEGQPFNAGEARINTIRNAHPGDSYGFRIEDAHSTFVFASDAEFKHLDEANMQPHLAFFKDAAALIFDAQYTLGEGWVKEDWGHSSAMIGVEMALKAGVKRLILFHHDPITDDTVLQRILAGAQAYRDELGGREALEIIVAYEGLALDLTPAGAVGSAFENQESTPILVPTQVFDEQSVQQVAEQLLVLDDKAIARGRIIDLSQVETLTTASLKQLVELQNAPGQAPLALAAPSPSALRVIELGGFLDFFAIYPAVEAAQTAVAARERAQLPGHVLGKRFLIERVLAESRMGAVLLASDPHTESTVAVRIIDPAYSEEAMQRLFKQREILLAADHPNLLPLVDLAFEAEIAYLVERYQPGKTLEDLLQKQPHGLSFNRAIEIALAIVSGIEYAHRQGIVHGNLKDDKMYMGNNRIQIGGMALGRLDEGLNLLEAPSLRQVVGYLAPEQVLGQPIDARTDLYALGVILYQLFSGGRPYEGEDGQVLRAHLDQEPPPLRDSHGQVSLSLEHLVLKLLAKNPADRYDSATAVRRILQALNAGDTTHVVEKETLFVGRENELRRLGELWQKARSGQGQLVFISGEQGVGKTRLTQELARQLQAPVVLVGHGLERRGGQAFSPFAEALYAYLQTVPPELFDAHAQKLIREFAAVIPDGEHLIPDLALPEPLEPQQEQLRRMSSMAGFISQATANRPWILVLDDLQWADDSSLALLRYLSFSLAQMPLLILAAYRHRDLPQAHPLNDLLSASSGHESVSQVELDRFDKFDLVELIIDEWDSKIPKDLLETIFQQTGGNPLFIREVIKSLVAEKLVTFDQGRWRYPEADAVQLPRTMQDVVRRRVDTLDAHTRTLLQQAAVLGQDFQIDVLRKMSDLSEWPLLESLDVALQNGFVCEAAKEGFMRFQHNGIRLALYEAIPAVRRRLWHKTAAEILEIVHEPDPASAAEILAVHFVEAEIPQKAIHYSYQAAEQAQAAYNNDAAVEWYRQVLKQIGSLETQEHEKLAATQLNLGKVLEISGDWEQARGQYENALRAAQTAGDRATAAWSQVALGELCRKQGLFEEALDWLEKACSTFEAIGDREGQAQVLQDKGNVAGQQVELDAAEAFFMESLALQRELGNRESIARLFNNLAVVAEYRGQFEEALFLHKQALALHRELGDQRWIGTSLNNIGYTLLVQREYDSARDYLVESISLQREIGDRWAMANALNNLGNVARETGNIVEARELYAESLIVFLNLQDPWSLAYLFEDIARLIHSEGDAQTSAKLVGAAKSLRSSIAAPLPPIEQRALDAFTDGLEKELGATFGEITGEDGTFSVEEALELALQFVSELS